ncbi:MAG: hypothetical protein A2W37_06130 [Chloroflexi bacterium RBG_16_63_12]|nr:MAG: hypothetical protein A2W37_06130 [Chloroflexi bacterium RBG_16_63_12]
MIAVHNHLGEVDVVQVRERGGASGGVDGVLPDAAARERIDTRLRHSARDVDAQRERGGRLEQLHRLARRPPRDDEQRARDQQAQQQPVQELLVAA